MRAYRGGCLRPVLATLCLIIVLIVIAAAALFAQPAGPPGPRNEAASKPAIKLERLELLELRDIVQQREILRLQAAEIERQLKELEKAFEAKIGEVAGKYKADPQKMRINLETGEVIVNEKTAQ